MRLLCFAPFLPLTGASADSHFLLRNWSINARVDFLACLGLPPVCLKRVFSRESLPEREGGRRCLDK